ncbi:MAG: peptidoglycan-binding protein [Ruminiclostridium sp.]
MPELPYIPEQITVHLGAPDQSAPNVTVPFPEYVKNVASSEIFPTWPEASLRANIYAITTFALNRVYTEWYRSRGYDFDITNNTQYDQKFIQGRDIFQSVSVIADELFNNYVVRQGTIEPYFTAFCNGTTVTCDGLSQYGTVALAEQGYSPYEILQYYYGDDINIVQNAPVRIITPSYPDRIVREGEAGNDVRSIQIQLNRISRNYPAIPKIPSPDGVFGTPTRNAVTAFQRIFGLPATGEVDKATWYKIGFIYTAVKRLAELDSEGISLEEVPKQFEIEYSKGSTGDGVRVLQYYLNVIGAYYANVQPVNDITGYFGEQTEASLKSFQRLFGLPITGVADRQTWYAVYDAYVGIAETLPPSETEVAIYPGTILKEGTENQYVLILQTYLSYISDFFDEIPDVETTGYFGPQTKAAVLTFQRFSGLEETGTVNAITWDTLAGIYSDIKFGADKRPYQFPGYVIR